MSMDATLQVRMDAEMKERVEKLYRSMGTTFAEAVRMMAAQSLIENGMPFKSTVNSSRAFGIAGARANPELIPMEKDAFERARSTRAKCPSIMWKRAIPPSSVRRCSTLRSTK